MRCAGVDGCRGGWCVVTDDDAVVVATFAEVLALPVEMIATDMPIGLAAARRCDAEARALLPGRASTIFTPPARAALHAGDYAATCAANRAACGKAISLQAFHLLPKIREVDAAMTRVTQRRVREAHPELAFAMAAGTVLAPKKTALGRRQRLRVLRRLGLCPADPRGDDILDAAILLWTARRVVAGTARVLGGERDDRGLRMEIVT